jgi:hypothetical protein
MPRPATPDSCPYEDLLHSATVPTVVSDPTSATRLYVAHNDQGHAAGDPGENSDPSDVDVVVRRVERVSTTPERWNVLSTVRVPGCVLPAGCSACTYVNGDPCAHPDAPQGSSQLYPDQFCPSIAVDRFGRVHLIYYSNQTTCGISALTHVYDAYYALSTDQGASFTSYNLRTCSQRPALDYTFATLDPAEMSVAYSPREYIGIALDETDDEVTYVAVSYSGTAYGANTTADRTAIYGQMIKVSNP